jgi:hypothetical protein
VTFRQYTVSKMPESEIPDAVAHPGKPPKQYLRLDVKPGDHSLPATVNVLGRDYLTGRFWVSTEACRTW